MTEPQVLSLATAIRNALPAKGSLDAAVEEALSVPRSFGYEPPAHIVEAARSIVAKEIADVEILHQHSIIAKRPQWYFGPKAGDRHWPALKGYLVDTKDWHADDVQSIHESSDEVVSLLENPAKTDFSCRGLVVGHVQSGKTANMTAVIAKAVDAGYNTIIVLSGLTNKLRHQTQTRLIEDLWERRPLEWQILTPNEENRDFRAPPHGGFLHNDGKAQLAVVKKNVSPLKQLKIAIGDTHKVTLSRLRVLVIDDECDQASVNSSSGELDMTAINERIRELLTLLPCVTYVGYTATPFANVFINPYKVEGQELDDLYPKDFITALPTPERYFGPEKLFGRPPVDTDGDEQLPEEDGFEMIRTVPEADVGMLQPAKAKDRDAFQPKLPDSLRDAVLYFLATCAARRARGQGGKHMSMLIHTSAYVAMHQKLAALVESWLDLHADDLAAGEGEHWDRLAELWAEEAGRVPETITSARRIGIDEVLTHMEEVLEDLEVPIENGASDDRIDYSGKPRTYIAVGGSVLARGLTLEGLSVSYFLRSANQYDSLLQMGRWFGYRPGYEDLPRIWTTDDLMLRFRALAGIEAEIRVEMAMFRELDVTPMEFAVKVRSLPAMAITAANKMKSASRCAISYWGAHRQTIRFRHRDRETVSGNWAAGASLVSRIDALGLRDADADAHLWRGVPASSVLNFFDSYKVPETQSDLKGSVLRGFIENAGETLSRWNVAIFEPRRGGDSDAELGSIGKVRLTERAKLTNTPETVADIKALMSRSDIGIDCDETFPKSAKWDELKAARAAELGAVPLLILYAVSGSSPAKVGSKSRADMDAVGDLLGFGVVFPGSSVSAGDYFSVDLQALSADELDEIDAEEKAQAEAAGVH